VLFFGRFYPSEMRQLRIFHPARWFPGPGSNSFFEIQFHPFAVKYNLKMLSSTTKPPVARPDGASGNPFTQAPDTIG
jgi:hypothetical protein